MRRLMSCVRVGELWYEKYTMPMLIKYAAKCGADFEILTQPSRLQPECVFYRRVEQIQFLASQDYYDQLLMVDLDVVPNLRNFQNAFDVLNDCEFGMVAEGWCDGKPNVHYGEYCKQMGVEQKYPYCNGGMIILTKEAARKIDTSPPYLMVPHYDQDYLSIKCFNKDNINSKVLPNKYNWVNSLDHDNNVVFFHCAFDNKWVIPSLAERFNEN